ncbi:MAG: CarD family transcriptional regulator [Ruminococcus sp.]|jgi:CarD family transcriptional regulator|nr:CarD family transcriptional regulator [Ruminococcus sp.]
MDYKIGDYVVYGISGVCHFEEIEKRNFEGVGEREYCKLIPIDTKGSAYYIPSETLHQKVRKPMTAEEIHAFIDDIPNIGTDFEDDNNMRKADCRAVIQSGDFRRMIGMTRALYLFRERQKLHGKKLPMADEKNMHTAENIIYSEFAFVLGIHFEQVENYILNRLENNE